MSRSALKMTSKLDFIETSYQKHAASYANYMHGEEKHLHAQTWLASNNVNAYRIQRLYALLDPFISSFPEARWLTVGDGRYGADAIYLKQKGAHVLPTDISDDLLKEAKACGLIEDYKKENAENLSFPENHFDFVFCKEAYHHFPRPSIALYEMLRVAKRGVILIEPIDREILPWQQTLTLKIKNKIKKIVNKSVERDFFEEDGNYLYAISKRECEKFALGLGLPEIVFKGINDIYIPGFEYAELENNNLLFKKMKRKLAFYNFFSALKLIPHNLLFSVILKQELTLKQKNMFKGLGYECITLPKNPYF